ncbi:hypothetical protein [Kitasatospora sp. NPDC018619]|uniref:hypothetical protein n=1 Tax=unclassified Kitasatospora TaxID=2633591 RepID=UPI0037B3D18C
MTKQGLAMRALARSILGRFGYVKASEVAIIDEYQAGQLRAADAFVECWTDSGLASSLISDYTTLCCDEAETYADVFRAFGYVNTADLIISGHADDDVCGTAHHACDAACYV